MLALKELVDGLVQLVYPNTCWACSQMMPAEAWLVCTTCARQLLDDPHATCPRCSSSVGPYSNIDKGCPACRSQSFAFDGVLRLGPYEGLLRDVILRMKQGDGEELAEAMGTLWGRQDGKRLRSLAADVLVPIPLHWWRRWGRGFNQSEVLAQALSQELGIPCLTSCLRRSRSTPLQTAQQSATARRENVRDAFAARQSASLRDKTILLIDDVLTTGATASEAARALRTCQPRRIVVAVLAHGQ